MDGRFLLPLQPYHRDISEVPSNRRAAFRRRQVLIADLRAQMGRAIDQGLTADAEPPHLRHTKANNLVPDLAVELATNCREAEAACLSFHRLLALRFEPIVDQALRRLYIVWIVWVVVP